MFPSLDRLLVVPGGSGQRTGLPGREFFVNQLHGGRNIEIARKAERHVVGHIIGLKVIADIDQRGFLEVFGRAERGLLAVGVDLEESRLDRFVENRSLLSSEMFFSS
jgi:hypothetical protein